MDRYLQNRDMELQILDLVYRIRQDHPTMGLRDMYYKLKPVGIGRDRFEELCKSAGLNKERKRNFRRTTDSSGVIRFDNLLVNLTIDHVNQVWQSDITYYELSNRFYYLTFILDAFSRVIVGYHVSQSLKTEHTTLPALRLAVKYRLKLKMNISNLIFHSDGGGQYYDKEFLSFTMENKIRNSMCEYPWDNGKSERINGVIKNNYLQHRSIVTFKQLIREVDRSVRLYNNEKPHIMLKRKTPIQFEKSIFVNTEN